MAEKRIKNELDTDYRIIGIATSLREYKLCYYFNQLLECDFRKLDDLVFESTDRTRTSQFSVFKANGTDGQTQYLVFANKSAGELLLPELGNFDYLLQIIGMNSDAFIHHITEQIKMFPEVVLTAEIPLKKIKSKERLVYEEKKPPRQLIPPKRFIR
jgi:hypothetical protein